MSDPVTNAEVEDVLSSIRRLVSEDKRPVQAQRADRNSAVAEQKKDRLVLTPALRVMDDDASQPSFPTADASAATETNLWDDASDDGDARGVELQSLVSEDDLLDVYPHDRSDQDQGAAADDAGELFDDDPSRDYSADPYNFDDDTDEDGEGNSRDLLRPPFADAEMAGDEAAGQGLSRTAALLLEPASAASSESAGDPSRTDASPGAEGKAAALSAKIAALETAIGQISETWEPDDAGDSDYAGSEPQSMAWEDDVPDQPAQKLADAVDTAPRSDRETVDGAQHQEKPEKQHAADDDNGASDGGFAFTTDEQLIDEEALRDLVADIVRSELQGALGERITRNVRKLVRREIHRALTAQELE